MPHRSTFAVVCLALFCLGAGGCTYEYDVVEPPDLAGHVGSKSDYVIKRDPLDYRMITYDNRLVIRVFNPTADPIILVGERSTLVDPSGQSHPLRGQTIAPQSFIKLILPPLRPQLEPGPSYGVGFGVGLSERRYFDRYGYWPGSRDWDGPNYLVVVDDNALYWDWDGQTEVRLTLAYDRAGKPFSDSFVFKRVKE